MHLHHGTLTKFLQEQGEEDCLDFSQLHEKMKIGEKNAAAAAADYDTAVET